MYGKYVKFSNGKSEQFARIDGLCKLRNGNSKKVPKGKGGNQEPWNRNKECLDGLINRLEKQLRK